MILPTCPDWNEDRPGNLSRIIANITALWPVVEADAVARPAPSLAIALEWHRRIYNRVAVPHPDCVGRVRDSDPRYPCLIDYEVAVGTARGVRARDVPGALDAFAKATTTVVAALDAAVPPGTVALSPPAVPAIVRLCTYAHGEWIRIHPFANGNGRTARVWANWIAVREGFRPSFGSSRDPMTSSVPARPRGRCEETIAPRRRCSRRCWATRSGPPQISPDDRPG